MAMSYDQCFMCGCCDETVAPTFRELVDKSWGSAGEDRETLYQRYRDTSYKTYTYELQPIRKLCGVCRVIYFGARCQECNKIVTSPYLHEHAIDTIGRADRGETPAALDFCCSDPYCWMWDAMQHAKCEVCTHTWGMGGRHPWSPGPFRQSWICVPGTTIKYCPGCIEKSPYRVCKVCKSIVSEKRSRAQKVYDGENVCDDCCS